MPLSKRSRSINNYAVLERNRYQISALVEGTGDASQEILLSVGTPVGGPVIRVYKVLVTVNRAGTVSQRQIVQFVRLGLPTGATLVTAADIPKKDTNSPDSSAVVRIGPNFTSGVPGQVMAYVAGSVATATGLGGPLFKWRAEDFLQAVTCRAGSAFILGSNGFTDADTRYGITVCWEEE